MVSELKMERNTQLPAATRRTSNPSQNSASVTVRSSRNSVLTDHSVFTSNAAGAGPALNLACTATEMAAPLSRGSKAGHSSRRLGGDFSLGSCATASPRNPRRRVRGAQLSNRRKAGAASFAAVQMKSKAGPADPVLGQKKIKDGPAPALKAGPPAPAIRG